MRMPYKIEAGVVAVSMLLSAFVSPLSSSAKGRAIEQEMPLDGKIYEFSKNSSYEVDAAFVSKPTSQTDTLGSLTISGEITEEYQKDGFTAYEIADDGIISLAYEYDDTLLNADKSEWHIASDSKKQVNGTKLDNKIQNGAVILQTSVDGKKWVKAKEFTDVSDNVEFSENNGINKSQLFNGCYYRVIVAYKTEKTEAGYFNVTDLFNTAIPYTECQKYAEVYTFYAGNQEEKNNKASANNEYYFYSGVTNKNEITKRAKKNDYIARDLVTSSSDPHYNWNLGEFCLSGFTEDIEDPDRSTDRIFMKNTGDKVKLTFKLKQDIDKLNNNTNLSIAKDKNGYDGELNTSPHNMGRGELIVIQKNNDNTSTIIPYSNFLEASASPNAVTSIRLFEEGDYEVHLNYAINNSKSLINPNYYQTAFRFKIRNSNCMFFVREVTNSGMGSELLNGSSTKTGFCVQLNGSKYIKLHVKKQNLNKTESGFIDDTRYNRYATDGEEFTDEGIYTITAEREFDNSKTTKIIYVGNNPLLTAYVNSVQVDEKDGTISPSLSITEIKKKLADGYTIDEDGKLIKPKAETTTTRRATKSTTSTTKTTTTRSSAKTTSKTTTRPTTHTTTKKS